MVNGWGGNGGFSNPPYLLRIKMSYFNKYYPQVIGFFGLLFLFIDSAIGARWNKYTHELLILATLFFIGGGVVIIKRKNIWMGYFNFSGIVAIIYGCAFLIMGLVCLTLFIKTMNM